MDNDPGNHCGPHQPHQPSSSPPAPAPASPGAPPAAGPDTTDGDDQAPSRPRTSLPSFSELMRSLAAPHPLPPHPPPPQPAAGPDTPLRLTPVFSEHPLVHSPTRVNFPSSTTSPTRAAPSSESTVIRPPRQQPNSALAPAPTTRLSGLETRVDASPEISSLATRGNPHYRIPPPHQQHPATASETTHSTQSRNFQFYLVDRTAPRTYRACTHCRQRKVKCETDPSRDRCRRCIDRGLRCEEAIPISPLVGNLLSSDRDLAPTYRKHRSESDPTLPREYHAGDDLDPETRDKLKELFTDPITGEYRVPSILHPAESSSTMSTSTSRRANTIDLTMETSTSPTRHRHTLSSEYRSSHRHNPMGSMERRSRLGSRGDLSAAPSSFREAKESRVGTPSSEKDNQSRPRAHSGPTLRTSSHIRSRPAPPQYPEPQPGPSRLTSIGDQLQHTPTSPTASPPISPSSHTGGSAGPNTPPSMSSRGQRFTRTHRRHVTSIQSLTSATDNPNESAPSSGAEGSRPVITLIRLIPAETLTESAEGTSSQQQQQVRPGGRPSSVEPIQIDPPQDDHEKK